MYLGPLFLLCTISILQKLNRIDYVNLQSQNVFLNDPVCFKNYKAQIQMFTLVIITSTLGSRIIGGGGGISGGLARIVLKPDL